MDDDDDDGDDNNNNINFVDIYSIHLFPFFSFLPKTEIDGEDCFLYSWLSTSGGFTLLRLVTLSDL
jgi:hypothetical protein